MKFKLLHNVITSRNKFACTLRNYAARSSIKYTTLENTEINEESVIFSGIQPTGIPHIGNYLGAIKQWLNLQNKPGVKYISIVDLHALTSLQPSDNNKLKEKVIQLACSMLACGIDPNKFVLFQQSSIMEHTNLSWVLSTLVAQHKLKQLSHWKEKAKEVKKSSNVGLYTYPILQSADILLYKATHVPVGDDQSQHIELARDVARTFNRSYGEYFNLVQQITNRTMRIKSLRQPFAKMSKSDDTDRGRINLTDSPDDIALKIKKAVTDNNKHVTYDVIRRPGVSNLINIYSGITDKTVETIVQESSGINNVSQLKDNVTESLITFLTPIRTEYVRLSSDKEYVFQYLKRGDENAQEIASKHWKEIKKQIGLL